MLSITMAVLLVSLPAVASRAAGVELNQDVGPYLRKTADAERVPGVVVAGVATEGEGFYSFEEAGRPSLAGAWRASANIGFTWPSSCSGFYVSRDYFLTALHCLSNCMTQDGRHFAEHSQGHLYQNMSPLSQKPEDLHCSEAALWTGESEKGTVDAQVVAVGNGATITREKNFSDFSPAQLQEFKDHRGLQSDWALLKLSRPSDDFACVRTGELKEDEPVWGIGFPASAERTHHSSDGRRKYITVGRKSPGGFYGNEWLQRANLSENIVQLLAEHYDDRMHWVTSDAYTGMSGGGVFDADGNALGVFAVLMVDGDATGGVGAEAKYYAGANGYLKMTYIVDEARRLLGEDGLHKAFACIR